MRSPHNKQRRPETLSFRTTGEQKLAVERIAQYEGNTPSAVVRRILSTGLVRELRIIDEVVTAGAEPTR